MSLPTAATLNPFVGLRPFDKGDTHVFFGRDAQVDELLRRLRTQRLVAVVGSSGGGKSSLVRAGLLPALEGGLVSGAVSRWRIVVTRPGGDPIGNLARELANSEGALRVGGIDPTRHVVLETILSRGSLGLIDAIRESELDPAEGVLVVVDQFEETFRFKRAAESAGSHDHAAAFVKLLLEAVRQEAVPICVVLTMRSEFLGNCSEFRGLPEAINEGLFLVPRLSRDQLCEAIAGPIAVAGARIAPSLTQRLLNDVGDDPDQLPVLQHALMRMWNRWRRDDPDTDLLSLEHYGAVKGMQDALSEHADEAFMELSPHARRTAERVFKRLTERGPDDREIRRPTAFGELCEVAEASPAEVADTIDRFRREGRSFLTPPSGEVLTSDTVVDISHESLIRKWSRLHDWVGQEAEDGRTYRRLAEAAVAHGAGLEPLWRDPLLTRTVEWRVRLEPKEAWARRYHHDFPVAMAFLDKSHRAHRSGRRRARLLKSGAILALGLALLAFPVWLDSNTHRKLELQAKEAGDRRRLDSLAQQKALGDSLLVLADARRVALETRSRTAEKLAREADSLRWNVMLKFVETRGGPETAALIALYLLRSSRQAGERGFAATAQAALEANLPHLARWKAVLPPPVTGIAMSPEGRVVSVRNATDQIASPAAAVWDSASGNQIGSLGPTQPAQLVALSSNAGTVAWISNSTLYWSGIDSRRSSVTDTSFQHVQVMALAPTGDLLVTGDDAGRVELRNLRSQARSEGPLGAHHSDAITAVAFSPEGTRFATVARDKAVWVWNLESRQPIARDTTRGKSATPQLAFSPKGTYLTVASDNALELWRSPTTDNEPLQKLDPDIRQPGQIRAFAFSPDQRYLAIATGPTVSILINRTPQGQISRTSPGVYRALTPFAEPFDQSVEGISFGPSSPYLLAIASADRTARVWDLSHRKEVERFFHASIVKAVTFVGDSAVATGQSDGTVSMFELRPASSRPHRQTPEALSRMVCRRIGRNLRTAEWDLYAPPATRYQASCPEIGLDPRDLLDYHVAASRKGDAAEARETLRQIDASSQKALLDPTRILEIATQHAVAGNRDFARNTFRLAAQLVVLVNAPGAVSNDVCWRGAIFDHPQEVLPACEQAVSLTGLFGYHDSRGVAAALIGQDTAQALRDFEKYVAEGRGKRDPARIELREAWIGDLRQGKNPFANPSVRAATLAKLRGQSPELPDSTDFKRLRSN